MVQDKKLKALSIEMERLKIYDKDLKETFTLGSSSGGQKVQKTHNCVELLHIPTNIRVSCHQDRMREVNRYKARVLLCEKIQELMGEKTKKDLAIEKKRKQKKRRSRRHNKESET